MTTKVAERATPKRGRPVKKVSTVLINAKAILENGKWTRGCLKRTNGSHCALGAILDAAGFKFEPSDKRGAMCCPTSIDVSPAASAAAVTLASVFGCEAVSVYEAEDVIAEANDDKTVTTKKKLLGKFDEAIVLAKRAERRVKPELVSA